jgi:hypothetical protein
LRAPMIATKSHEMKVPRLLVALQVPNHPAMVTELSPQKPQVSKSRPGPPSTWACSSVA